MHQGKLLSIATREKSRGEMHEFDSIGITTERGCNGDFRGKPGPRQVTVMSTEAWQATCDEIGSVLDWKSRRANLLVDGLELENTTGATIAIGDVLLEVTGETDPCSRMCEFHPELEKALSTNWRGGVVCRVRQSGHVTTGDSVTLESAASKDA